MADSTLPVTFGVEIELVFAFHESLLQAHLDAGHPGAPIVKNLTPAQRIYLNEAPTEYLNTIKSYASWGLTGGSSSSAAKSSADGTIRTYGDEPLYVANGILPGRLAYVHQGPDKARDFARWHFTNESRLIGVNEETLQRELGNSYGLELVSRVLPLHPDSFTEINTTLAAIIGSPTSLHGAFVTPLCGLHVHVGLAPGSTPSAFPLSTLQHLAYLLVMYETQTTIMHPPHRRDGGSAGLGSNRTAFRLDPAGIVRKYIFDPVTRTASWRKRWVYMQSLAEIRAAIFAPAMTLPDLVALMGGVEELFVNWTYLLRPAAEGPATLEFRQHEGTLYGPGVKWWVMFVTGLVQLADRLANEFAADVATGDMEAEPGLKGFRFHRWHENMSFVDLFEMMGFPLEGRRYLGRRIVHHGWGLKRVREETPESGSGDEGEIREDTVLGKRGRDDDDDDNDGEDGGARWPPALRR